MAAAADHFAAVAELGSMSSSQEPPLDSSPIPFISSQDSDSGDLPVESTAIRMESPPETPDQENEASENDEDDGDTLVIGGDSAEEDAAAVDLNGDTDPSIEPESGSTERFETGSEDEVILCESEELRVLDGGLGFGDGVCESLIELSRNTDRVGGSGIPGREEKNRKGLTRWFGLLQFLPEHQEGGSCVSKTPLQQTPQSSLGSDTALVVVQRSAMSLEKMGSPLKRLTTWSEKKQMGSCSSRRQGSICLQTPQDDSVMEPALALQRTTMSLEKLGSPLKGLTTWRENQQLGSCSSSRRQGSICLQDPQADSGMEPALALQRAAMSLEKLGSPLKGLTTWSEKKQMGSCSSSQQRRSICLQTPQADSGMEPALVLQRSLKSLEKLGSAVKERIQESKSIKVASACGKSAAAGQGSGAKRKLEFLSEGLDSAAAAETNVEHMTTTSQEDPSPRRSSKRAKETSRSSPKVAALLGLLKIFAEKEDVHDSAVESMSLIDICKMRGMKFPSGLGFRKVRPLLQQLNSGTGSLQRYTDGLPVLASFLLLLMDCVNGRGRV